MIPIVLAVLFAAEPLLPAFAKDATTVSPAQVRLVAGLYARKSAPDHVAQLFARDLARAYHKDVSHPGEVGEIDFDWRYGAQDFEIKDLKIEAVRLRPGAMPMANSGSVRATFRNFDQTGEVDYRLCRNASGAWRIADVSSSSDPKNAWDLRALLKLDPVKVRC